MDLRTSYLGLDLASPLVLAASPLTRRLDTVQALAAAGVGAVVVHSLFEEALEHATDELERTLERGTGSSPEASSYFPDIELSWPSPTTHLHHVAKLVEGAGIPVIGSPNGRQPGGWITGARSLQDAGAAAIELNLYYLSADLDRSSQDIEDEQLELVAEVRKHLTVPLSVKIGPSYAGLPAFCRRLAEAGADGLVLFNRFYQSDLDLETLDVVPSLQLSTSHDLLQPLRWTAILAGRVDADIALSGGVHTATDLTKSIAAGATVVQCAASLLQHGPDHARVLLDGLRAWLTEREYDSVSQLRGSMAQGAVADPTAYERANYLRALRSWDDRALR